MQFMILFTRHPDKAATSAPIDLREEVAEKLRELPLVRGGYLQSLMIVPLKPYSRLCARS